METINHEAISIVRESDCFQEKHIGTEQYERELAKFIALFETYLNESRLLADDQRTHLPSFDQLKSVGWNGTIVDTMR